MSDPQRSFDSLVQMAHAAGASDLHLVPHEPPRLRIEGRLKTLNATPLSPAELEAMARAHFGEARLARQAREGSVQRPFRAEGGVQGRSTLSSTRGDYSISLRFQRGPTSFSLELIRAPELLPEWLAASHGLIVVAGPHGSGKTTTLYAMAEWLNEHRELHLCTVEDPLSYELASKRALVQQREVGVDVPSVAAGVAAALGQDLDALVVAALPDLEALSAVLHAAETGHLVLVQVHANSAEEALERIVEATPSSMHPMVRRSLSEALVGVVAQRLVPKVAGGRVAVYETLVPGEALRGALLGGASRGLPRGAGSSSFSEDLERLVAAGAISAEAAGELRARL